jgi:hypothetical protein
MELQPVTSRLIRDGQNRVERLKCKATQRMAMQYNAMQRKAKHRRAQARYVTLKQVT